MPQQSSSSAPANFYRELLEDKRQSVMAGLGMKFDTLAKLGRVAEEDQAQVTHDEFVSLRLNRMEYLKLKQVQSALDRLAAGDYGVCLECEEAIPDKRLKAIPWAQYCVPCQERRQQMQDEDGGALAGQRDDAFSLSES